MQKVFLENLGVFVRDVLSRLVPLNSTRGKRATIVALSGELGAGKTTFVQALAKELGVQETVQSPTYVLMKSYDTTNARYKKLVHIDLYRLEKPEEFAALKPEEFLSTPNALVCIEWPERVGEALPKPHLTLTFSADGATDEERYIEIT